MPAALASSYWAALRRVPDVVRAMANSSCDEAACRVAAAALAVANGHGRLAEAILALEPSLLDAFMAWVTER